MKIKARVILASMVFVIVGMVLMFNHRRGVAFNVYAAPPNACTNQTIGGHFVFTEQGFLSASNTGPQLIGMFAPAAGIGVLDSDGQGNLSGSDTLSIGGLIIPRTFTGTYSLNPDCTVLRIYSQIPGRPSILPSRPIAVGRRFTLYKLTRRGVCSRLWREGRGRRRISESGLKRCGVPTTGVDRIPSSNGTRSLSAQARRFKPTTTMLGAVRLQ